jgi:flagellum-specific peptidoglycan hydrolase FlgJ
MGQSIPSTPAHLHHKKRHHALHGDHNAFIASAVLPAQQCEFMTRIPASVTIAQAILEAGWGHHHIGKANNYFGVKAFKKNGAIQYGNVATGYVDAKTREHLGGKDVIVSDHFRTYASMAASFLDHGKFLAGNARYAKAIKDYAKTGDAEAFAHGLQTAGYATDPHYAELLIRIMKRNGLYQYNQSKPKPS